MISSSSDRRREALGFTLVELLVVIAIIVVLVSLVSAFIFGAGERRRVGNTETAIQTINKLFQHHWSQVVADAKKEDLSDTSAATGWGNLLALSGQTSAAIGDPSLERTRVILIKLRLMEAFPVTYDEVNNSLAYNNFVMGLGPKVAPDPVHAALDFYIPKNRRKYSLFQVPATAKKQSNPISAQTYNKFLFDTEPIPGNRNNDGLLHTINNAGHTANDSLSESSACLFMALSAVTRGGVTFPQDSLAYAIADTDGDGIKEFIDAWVQRTIPPIPPYAGEPTPSRTGNPQPLRFYRFAWNTAAYNSTHPINAPGAVTFPDPIDSHGTLLNNTWYNSAQRPIYEAIVGSVIRDPASQNNNYIIPVIASSGSDNYFGLPAVQLGGVWNTDLRQAAPAGVLSAVNIGESDNIYSFSLRNQ